MGMHRLTGSVAHLDAGQGSVPVRAYLPPRHSIIYPADIPPEPAPSPEAIEA